MPLLEQSKTREIYQSIKRSLQLKEGFGLFFIICTPSQAQDITKQIKEDFGNLKNIESLILTEEVPQLHEKITTIQQQKPLDILLISGIEKSLNPYVKSGIEADQTFGGRAGYYQLDLISLPPLLAHLNLQRESYKQSFPFALVFFLSPFAYRFLVRRAPDFFDWRSGIFEVPKDPREVELEANRIIAERYYDYKGYITLTPEAREREIKTIKGLINEPYLNEQQTKKELYFELGLLYIANKDYDYAIQSYDQALKIQPDYSNAWYGRGFALGKLGRYEEEIQSYDQALKIQPDYSNAWYGNACCYAVQEKITEAILHLRQAIKLNPQCLE